jgi:hypothetical protein
MKTRSARGDTTSFDKNYWHFNFAINLFCSPCSPLLDTRTFFAIPFAEKMHPFFLLIIGPKILLSRFLLCYNFCSSLINMPIIYIEEIETALFSVADPGSGIGCLFDPWIRHGRKSESGSGIRDEQPGSYFLELRNQFFCFFGVKIHQFFEDPGSGMETVWIRDPGWKKVGSGIRYKHPGSATLALLTLFGRVPGFIEGKGR